MSVDGLLSSVIAGTAGATGVNPEQPPKQLVEAAEKFESLFIAQMLRGMTTDLAADGLMGNPDTDAFSSMLQEEYGKLVSRAGGIGVADAVLQELLKAQEVE
ncbi:MAG: rod-binding protein [Geminicoccaceae bacterium]